MKFKNIDYRLVVIYVVCIVVILIGASYAVSVNDTFNVNTATMGIDTESYGSTSFSSDDLKIVPILDNKVTSLMSGADSSVSDNVIKIDFKVRGANTNPSDCTFIYDVVLSDLNISSELMNKYLKWVLYKNGSLLTEGNFSGEVVSISNNRMVLTDSQQDLKDYSSDADSYSLVIWLSDVCQSEDISECVDTDSQSDMVNKSISGIVVIEVYSGNKGNS